MAAPGKILFKKQLTKLIHCNIDSCIKFLEKNDFLESDKKYIPNRKSFYYQSKATSFQVYSITEESPLYERLAKKYKAKKTNWVTKLLSLKTTFQR